MKKFFSLGLIRGLIWQAGGMLVGGFLVSGIRFALGLDPLGKFFFTEPAWVVAGLFGVLAFIIGVGGFSDWYKMALGEDVHEDHELLTGWTRYLGYSLDHKVIGIQYTITSLLLLSVAGLFALIFRTELASSGQQFLKTSDTFMSQNGLQWYNTLMSLHGIVMIVSILLGIAGVMNYLVPMLIGARDMAFPRLNAFSFWIAVPAAVLLSPACSLAVLIPVGPDTLRSP